MLTNLLPGTIVHYRPREGETGWPAIVMGQWPDESVRLCVFQFDTTSHIRSAAPADLDVMLNPVQFAELAERYILLEKRVGDLEDLTETLMPLFKRLQAVVNEAENQRPAPQRPQLIGDAVMDDPLEPLDVRHCTDAEDEDVDSTPVPPQPEPTPEPEPTVDSEDEPEPEPVPAPSPWRKKR